MEQQRTILLVDDDNMIRRSLCRLFTQAGFNVLSTDNVNAALILLTEAEVHVVVTDLDMPVRNGEDMAREARARKPHVLIVLNTGRPEAADHTLFDYVVAKGSPSKELLRCLA